MNNDSVTVLALLTMSLALLFVFACVQPVHAALTIIPSGSWSATGTGASGSVGDIVTIEFAITHITDSDADTDFYIETVDEARQKLSFMSVVSPADSSSVSAEKIEWPGTEFEAGVTKKYKIRVRIDQGVVGDEIEGFYVSTYTGKSAMNGVVDDIKVKVVVKSSPKPTVASTPIPTQVTVVPISSPTKVPTSVAASVPITIVTTAPTSKPINSIDTDGDGLPNDQEAIWGSDPYVFDTDGDGMPDGDEVRNGTSPAGDIQATIEPTTIPTIEPQPSPEAQQQSFLGRMFAGIGARIWAIGNWFAELF